MVRPPVCGRTTPIDKAIFAGFTYSVVIAIQVGIVKRNPLSKKQIEIGLLLVITRPEASRKMTAIDQPVRQREQVFISVLNAKPLTIGDPVESDRMEMPIQTIEGLRMKTAKLCISLIDEVISESAAPGIRFKTNLIETKPVEAI